MEDYRDDKGRIRKRILKSFGNASNPGAVEDAAKFAHAYNAAQELRKGKLAQSEDELKALFIGLIGAAALAALIALLFRDEE